MEENLLPIGWIRESQFKIIIKKDKEKKNNNKLQKLKKKVNKCSVKERKFKSQRKIAMNGKMYEKKNLYQLKCKI